jgi:hypothetical protein
MEVLAHWDVFRGTCLYILWCQCHSTSQNVSI